MDKCICHLFMTFLRVHQKYVHTVKDQFLLTRMFTVERNGRSASWQNNPIGGPLIFHIN